MKLERIPLNDGIPRRFRCSVFGKIVSFGRIDSTLNACSMNRRNTAGSFFLQPSRTPQSREQMKVSEAWLANCYFSQDSSGFPVLLRFCDARSGRSFHPPHRYPGPLARTWWRPFHSCGVASPQAPTPDRESPQAPIAESMRVGPHPRRFDGALGASYSSAPVRNRTEARNTARPPQSLEPAKVPHAVLTESPSEARPERTEYRTHRCGRRNEAA